MGGGGGGKGSSESKSKPLPYIEAAVQQALNLGDAYGRLGIPMYTGPEVAAFDPQQVQAMQGYSDAGAAFGMNAARNVATDLPQAENYGGGINGISSFPTVEKALATWAEKFPGQAEYLKKFMINPVTGEMPDVTPWGDITYYTKAKKK